MVCTEDKKLANSLRLLWYNVMGLHHPMYNWYLCSGNLVDRDITNVVPLSRGIREEEQVSAGECGFHRFTNKDRDIHSIRHRYVVRESCANGIPQDDDDRRFSIGQESETFPDHEARSHDRRKVEYLQQNLMCSRRLNRHGQLVVVLRNGRKRAVHVASLGVASS